MSFYPICLDLEGRPCVVVGGGRVAERKVLGLLSSSAQVSVISPELTAELLRRHNAGIIEWISREYRPGDLEQAFLVIAATDDEETQKQVYEEAAAHNLLLNVADVPQRCNFILPATVRRGELEKRFGVEYRALVDILGVIRPVILASGLEQSDNEQLFKKLLHDDMVGWIRAKDWSSLENHFEKVLGDRVVDDWLQRIRPFYL
jgi:precorrin-2 dehydrogenase/sirohydrochlorin ferrochelatase